MEPFARSQVRTDGIVATAGGAKVRRGHRRHRRRRSRWPHGSLRCATPHAHMHAHLTLWPPFARPVAAAIAATRRQPRAHATHHSHGPACAATAGKIAAYAPPRCCRDAASARRQERHARISAHVCRRCGLRGVRVQGWGARDTCDVRRPCSRVGPPRSRAEGAAPRGLVCARAAQIPTLNNPSHALYSFVDTCTCTAAT